MTSGLKKDIMINLFNTTIIMKRKAVIFLTVLSLTLSGAALAQTSQQDCILKGSMFIEPAKAKNYEAALPNYQPLVDACPTYSLATYQYGEKMFQHYIKEGDKSKINDLVKLYRDRLTHFPEKTDKGEVELDIAQLKFDNDMGTKMEQYKAFENVFNNYSEDFKSPKSLYTYFSLAVDLFNEGAVEIQSIFDLYDSVTEKLDIEEGKLAKKVIEYGDQIDNGEALSEKDQKRYSAYEKNLDIFSKVKGSVDGKLGQLADCPNLIPLYNKDFDTMKNDIKWINKAASRLSAKDCTSDPLFIKLVEQLDRLEPSADTKMYLGQLEAQKGNGAKALAYYEESANMQTDPNKQAKIFYKIAEEKRKAGSLGTARTYYNKMIEVKPNAGIAYLKIAQMIAGSSNSCGSTPFEKRAINWKAAEFANKAARVDPSIASNAQAAASSYMQRAPSKNDIFVEGMQGKTISFNCWVGGSVRVPNL